MAIYVSWRTLNYVPAEFTVTISNTTDIPCHTWARVSLNPPDVHRVARMKRGLSMPEEYYFCFTAYTDYEQLEAGDTLVHTFLIPDWPFCTTKYFYFFGCQNWIFSKSTSAWFSYHNKFIPPAIGFVGLDEIPLVVSVQGAWSEIKWSDGSPLSAHLPDNVSCLFIHAINTGSNNTFGVRRGDSITDIKDEQNAGTHLWCQVGYTKISGSRAWLNSTINQKLYLTGYASTDAVQMYANPVEFDVPTTWTWVDKNFSLMAPGAKMLFLILKRSPVENFAAVRCKGASYDRNTTFILAYPTIACNAGQVIQAKNSAWFGGKVRFYLSGYIKSYSGSWVNTPDIKPTLANVYQVRNVNPKPGVAFIEVSSGSVGVKTAVKKNGSAVEIYRNTTWGFQWAAVPMDAAGNIQVKASVANHPMWQHGYGV